MRLEPPTEAETERSGEARRIVASLVEEWPEASETQEYAALTFLSGDALGSG